MNTDRFKFRVWSNIRKAYCPETIYIDQQGKMCRPALDDDKEYVIEQCTGLRDKNGTLIYEGDVVKFAFPGIAIHVVGWCTKTSRFVLHEINQKPEDVSGIFAVSIRTNEQYEVIGNIHEVKQ